MTWLLVRTIPSREMTIPVPAASLPPSASAMFVLMSTIPGLPLLATAAVLADVGDGLAWLGTFDDGALNGPPKPCDGLDEPPGHAKCAIAAPASAAATATPSPATTGADAPLRAAGGGPAGGSTGSCGAGPKTEGPVGSLGNVMFKSEPHRP